MRTLLLVMVALLVAVPGSAVAQDLPAIEVSYEATSTDRNGQVRIFETGIHTIVADGRRRHDRSVQTFDADGAPRLDEAGGDEDHAAVVS